MRTIADIKVDLDDAEFDVRHYSSELEEAEKAAADLREELAKAQKAL